MASHNLILIGLKSDTVSVPEIANAFLTAYTNVSNHDPSKVAPASHLLPKSIFLQGQYPQSTPLPNSQNLTPKQLKLELVGMMLQMTARFDPGPEADDYVSKWIPYFPAEMQGNHDAFLAALCLRHKKTMKKYEEKVKEYLRGRGDDLTHKNEFDQFIRTE